MDLTQFSAGLIAYIVVVVFLAGVVRGYSGFGFSALVTLSLALFLPPAMVIPMLMLMEIMASIQTLPRVWKQVDRVTLTLLMAGSVVSVPLGAYLLANLPDSELRLVISTMVLVVTIILWRGYRFPARGRKGLSLATGLGSGMMTGAAGAGGLIVAVMFLSISAHMAVIRATMIAYVMFQSSYMAVVAGIYGLMNLHTLISAVVLAVPMFAGVMVGHRTFVASAQVAYRRFVLILLMVLSVAGIVRALMG
ncbi:hypothetical protein B1C78_17145 [Thioalkalivibrio denitrificans]|uniref:Probable membrane transporter protein n=1 Tax=Thioalkalivibrio denitrificans TaxID=108003 RepID=A0A1V3N694_9GAMM|nr:sulfite exporter TauE/SafE family protein [Thioalkalivibrio denitrificans]OOG20617.1 hypothetical protein B1C78_17145 [Thioalkalivibrio denitrificans]